MQDIALVAGLVFLYALLSAPLARLSITGPMFFVMGGILLGDAGIDALDFGPGNEGVALLAERLGGPTQTPADMEEELGLPVLDCFASSERNTEHSTDDARAPISPSTGQVERAYVESV